MSDTRAPDHTPRLSSEGLFKLTVPPMTTIKEGDDPRDADIPEITDEQWEAIKAAAPQPDGPLTPIEQGDELARGQAQRRSPSVQAADFVRANDRSFVVAGRVLGAGGQGAIYTLEDRTRLRLGAEASKLLPEGYPKWKI